MSVFAIAYDSRSFIVRFRTDWPAFGIDNSDVVLLDDDVAVSLLEPTGNVIVRRGDRFVRTDIGDIGTPGWPGTAEADLGDGTTTAPGLNEYITENQPEWASDPTLFAVQIEPSLDANERLEIDFDETTGVLTLTTSGLLDDSVAAVRRTIQTERWGDGLLRFVSGTFGQRCQPGRGHQDFTTELCN